MQVGRSQLRRRLEIGGMAEIHIPMEYVPGCDLGGDLDDERTTVPEPGPGWGSGPEGSR